MSVTSPRSGTNARPPAPLDWSNAREWIRKVAEVANLCQRGKTNNVSTVTLATSAATTTITDERVGADTAVVLVPTTANASGEFSNGTIYQTYPNATEGQAVINHANNAQADRTYVVVFVG